MKQSTPLLLSLLVALLGLTVVGCNSTGGLLGDDDDTGDDDDATDDDDASDDDDDDDERTYELTLMDDFGDGWEGSILDVYDGSGELLDDLTLEEGSSETFYVTTPDCISTRFFAKDGWADECSYKVVGPEGDLLFTSGLSDEGPGSFTDCSSVPGDDDDDEDEVATISGVVVRVTDLVLEGTGSLSVRLRSSPPGQGGGPQSLADVVTIEDVDFSDKGAAIEFLFEDVEVRDKPYFVTAVFDEDESGGPPSEVDLRSTPIEVLADEPTDYEIVVELTSVGGGGPGPGDDDDDDDDDDDSAGEGDPEPDPGP